MHIIVAIETDHEIVEVVAFEPNCRRRVDPGSPQVPEPRLEGGQSARDIVLSIEVTADADVDPGANLCFPVRSPRRRRARRVRRPVY